MNIEYTLHVEYFYFQSSINSLLISFEVIIYVFYNTLKKKRKICFEVSVHSVVDE